MPPTGYIWEIWCYWLYGYRTEISVEFVRENPLRGIPLPV